MSIFLGGLDFDLSPDEIIPPFMPVSERMRPGSSDIIFNGDVEKAPPQAYRVQKDVASRSLANDLIKDCRRLQMTSGILIDQHSEVYGVSIGSAKCSPIIPQVDGTYRVKCEFRIAVDFSGDIAEVDA